MIGRITQACQRLANVGRQDGLSSAASLVIDRLGKRLMNFDVMQVVWLYIDRLPRDPCPDSEFTFRFLTPEEVLSYSDNPALLNPSFAIPATRRGDRCFAALWGNRLAAYSWYAIGSIEEGPCCSADISFPADVAYVYASFTAPDFRGKRLHGLAMGLALRALSEHHGVTQLFAMVNWTNWDSLRSFFRLGYEGVGWMITIGGSRCRWRRYPREPMHRGVHFGRQARLRVATDGPIDALLTASLG
jgi:hypothetical protein